jgi:Ca2+-binding EF-hand superfamily protein
MRRPALALLLLAASGSACALARTPAEYLQRMDADADGRISLREYQDYLSRGFVAMDLDGDGRLSASEMPAGTRARRAPTLESHRRALAATFDRQDANNDGHLDARELAAPPR